jgi:hypothetical protein
MLLSVYVTYLSSTTYDNREPWDITVISFFYYSITLMFKRLHFFIYNALFFHIVRFIFLRFNNSTRLAIILFWGVIFGLCAYFACLGAYYFNPIFYESGFYPTDVIAFVIVWVLFIYIGWKHKQRQNVPSWI